MERLTERYESGGISIKGCTSVYSSRERKGAFLNNAIARPAAYEDAMPLDRARELAQAGKDGRLVVLPCKVGDTVYRVITPRDAPAVIIKSEIKTFGQAADLIGRIGKRQMLVSWYSTQEEAEAALKKREAENDEKSNCD